MHLGLDSHSAERAGEGNATFARNLIRGLVATRGEDTFTLFATEPTHPFYRALPVGEGCRVRGVAPGRGLGRIVCGLGRAASRERVDCLHVDYFAPLRYHGPLAITVHDLGFLHVPESFPRGLRVAMRVLVPWSIRRASRVLAVSEFSRRDLQARYRIPPEKISVMPGAAHEAFRVLEDAEVRRVLGRYNLEPGYLFSLGRLNRRKNLGRLVMAYRALRAAGACEAPLVIGGKPDHGWEEVRRIVRASPDAQAIRWAGLIPEDDLPAFYAGAACFVYPSLFEGFGLPVLEAMACGCPVVSSDRTSLPELVGDAGLLVDPERVDAIAGAVARVLADGALRADLRARGLSRSRQFTWEETARRAAAVFREAAGGTGRGSVC